MNKMNFDSDEVKELLCSLIKIQSMNPPGDVDNCAMFIKDWFLSNGIEAEIIRSNGVSNVVARIGNPEGRKLLWNGHFDVVPPGENWSFDPFAATEKDGFIYGRGASDMKSGVAAMMIAMKELKNSGAELSGLVEFWGIGDEETGSENGTWALLEKLGNNYDGAVSSEPTDFYVENAQRGLRWIDVEIKGSACHAGRPHVGKNAVEYSAKVIDALKKIKFSAENSCFEEHIHQPSLSVTIINGGRQTNIIPEQCNLTVDRRMLPGETEKQVMSEIDNALAALNEPGFSLKAKIISGGWDPFITDLKDAVVTSIDNSYRNVMNTEPLHRGKGGCTDASHLYHSGIPVVIIGPGSADESHTADEKVSVKRMAEAAEIYANAAVEFLR